MHTKALNFQKNIQQNSNYGNNRIKCGRDGINIFADPIVGYFYKTYILGVPQDLSKALAKIGALTTSVNAVIAVIFASVIYLILRPVLKKSGMLREM